MEISKGLQNWLAQAGLCAIVAVLTACGGGGGGVDGGDAAGPATGQPGATPAPAPAAFAASAATDGLLSSRALVSLRSDAGDFIGAGASHDYDTSNAAIRLQVSGSHLNLMVQGREHWTGDFQLPGNLAQLQVGTFAALPRYPALPPGSGGLSWHGQWGRCDTVVGSLTIESVSYQAGRLQSLAMHFEQRCGSSTAALRGQVRIDASAMALVTLPQNPLPQQPVVALQSDIGDYIGGGATYAYDHSSAFFTVSAQGPLLEMRVEGDQRWFAQFLLPGATPQLLPGTYAALVRYPFQAAGAGAISWTGEGRSCNTMAGQVVVNSLRYEGGVLAAISLDFVQHCEAGAPALRGQVRWDSALTGTPASPQLPMPAHLWQPPEGSFPALGNAMYLHSSPGDFVGQGWTWSVGAAAAALPPGSGSSRSTATVSVSEDAGLLRVQLNSSDGHVWAGEFKGPRGMTQLQAGYYGIVKRNPFHNPALGGMSWAMESRGCNQLDGWFAVDSIRYEGGRLQAVDLRFTQFCDASIAPLRGRIRWDLSRSGGI